MSDILPTSIGYISPVGDYGLHNSQALGGVSHLWQDFFAQALAEQVGEMAIVEPGQAPAPVVEDAEPTGGSEMLAHIHSQRLCDVRDTEVKPPEPLFLPIAEFETELLDKAPEPFPADEIVAQQKHLQFDNEWVRPVVMNVGQAIAEPGPGPQPRHLHLPIAEFEWELADKYVPYAPEQLAEQQKQLDIDLSWARPVVLQNVRLAA